MDDSIYMLGNRIPLYHRDDSEQVDTELMALLQAATEDRLYCAECDAKVFIPATRSDGSKNRAPDIEVFCTDSAHWAGDIRSAIVEEIK